MATSGSRTGPSSRTKSNTGRSGSDGRSSAGEEGQRQQDGQHANSTHYSKPNVKPIRFGIFELGIFVSLWIVIVVGFRLYTNYRSRRQTRKQSWFGRHEEREAYERLLQEDPDNEEGLKRALVRRAMTDFKRLMRTNEERDSLHALSKAGAISEEMWADFKTAEKELELEIFDLQAEAETFKEGWSQEIIRDAARLSRLEDELNEGKRSKEREAKQKADEEKQRERDATNSRRRQQLEEEEKKRLLVELLEQEEREAAASKQQTLQAGSKAKQRPAMPVSSSATGKKNR